MFFENTCILRTLVNFFKINTTIESTFTWAIASMAGYQKQMQNSSQCRTSHGRTPAPAHSHAPSAQSLQEALRN
jgi:hypothetical protein